MYYNLYETLFISKKHRNSVRHKTVDRGRALSKNGKAPDVRLVHPYVDLSDVLFTQYRYLRI
jgi:hypothetical protein